jgi:hypothetical protein
MRTCHVAYGLDLDVSFPLPGMPQAAPTGLPSLALELRSPSEIEAAWSGAVGPPAWTGRLGDGSALVIERGVGDDVLLTYGDRARFRLDATRKLLECAPLRAGLHWQQVLLGRILPNVALMRGYEALHASAVDSPEGVVALAAPSGTGKTTLALELVRRGWALFADDVLTFGEDATGVRAHRGTPHMNVSEDAAATAPPIGVTLGTLAGERWTSVDTDALECRPVRMICMLDRRPELALEARVLPSSPLPLAPYMLGLPGDMLGLPGGAERERRRFARYADLMSCATLMRLTCGAGHRPADMADLIEGALAGASELSALGAAG